MGSGHTQDPRQDSTVTSRVPPEVPDPPSYHVESVPMATLYQSYNPISHTPPRITIHVQPPLLPPSPSLFRRTLSSLHPSNWKVASLSPFALPLLTYKLFYFLVIISLPIRSTCPNHFNTFRSNLLLNFSGTSTLSLTTSQGSYTILKSKFHDFPGLIIQKFQVYKMNKIYQICM